ncbi:MAG: DUF86 domain-containing protein [Nitrospinae bacterium]|nr:DUF86 domain-containing protein [Nitrospinota bacterium]
MRRDDAWLLDMLLAARDVVDFARGRTRDDLNTDRQLVLSLVKSIEIIGEAAARIRQETREAHPEIPWPKIIAMRNRLVHAYFEINLRRVWEVVQNDLPDLISLLEPLVPPEKT